MIDFGNLNIESNKKDYSLLHKLIKKCIDEIKESMINQFAEIVEKSKHQTALVFEKRPVYVLFEQELNCNPETDHLAPKNLYPIFKPKIEVMFDQILKVINGYTTTELISAEEKVAMLCRQILAEITEINDYLIVELITKSTESDKFQQLADTQKVKNLNEQQNMRKRISLLKEQIMGKRRTGVMYSPDFLKDINEASEFKNSVSGLNDRFKTVAIRNGNLEAENAKMKGQLEIFSNSNEYLDRTIKELDKIKQAYVILQNKYVTVTNNLTEDDEKVTNLTNQITKQEQIIRLFAARLDMYGDDPDQVAADNVLYLTIEQIQLKFSPLKYNKVQTTQTLIDMQKMNLLDSGDSINLLESYKEQLSVYQQHFKNPIHKFIQTDGRDNYYDPKIFTHQQQHATVPQSTASPTRTNQSFAINQMSLSGGNVKDSSQEQLTALVNQLGRNSIESLENLKAVQIISDTQKALTAGAKTLNVREVNFDTNNDSIEIQDHSLKYDKFIRQNINSNFIIDDKIHTKSKNGGIKKGSFTDYDLERTKRCLKKSDQYDSRQQLVQIKNQSNKQKANTKIINNGNKEKIISHLHQHIDNIQYSGDTNNSRELQNTELNNTNVRNKVNNSSNCGSKPNQDNNNSINIQNMDTNKINDSQINHNSIMGFTEPVKYNYHAPSPGGHCICNDGQRVVHSEIQNIENLVEKNQSNNAIFNQQNDLLVQINSTLISPSGQIYQQNDQLLNNTPLYNNLTDVSIPETTNIETLQQNGNDLFSSPGGRMYTKDRQLIIGSDDPILASRYRQAANLYLSDSLTLRSGTIMQMFVRLDKNQQNMLEKRQIQILKLEQQSKQLWQRLVNSRIHQPTLDALEEFNTRELADMHLNFNKFFNKIDKVYRVKSLPITQNLINIENKIQEKLIISKLQGTIKSQQGQQYEQEFNFNQANQTNHQQLPDMPGNQLLMSVRARNTQKITPSQNHNLNQFGMKSMNAMLPQSGLTANKGMPGRSISMLKK
ncbi:hypothetical protein SS50377_25348 [Spironucleus salmonicida]|nr:hypothetical protein SS50377_25348 [Spironucleus salmonicida]